MKNRRQSKLAKTAKKAAVVTDNSPDKFAKSDNKEKDTKKSKKNLKVSWESAKAEQTPEQDIRITTNVKGNNNSGKTSSKACDKVSKKQAVAHAKGSKHSNTAQPATDITEDEKALDVQTYLDTLPSEEIRQFIEGLIAEDKFNMLPVNTSAIIGNAEMMEKYFRKNPVTGKSKYDPNGRCLDGGTPLHAAIKAKNKQSVKLLLQNGADCSLVDFMGDNAIMAAIKAGDATVINTIWPFRGSLNVDHCNMLGMTALHLAAERSWEACTNFLLQNRASPNLANGSGVTPLMIAASKGDLKVVECMVKSGADVCVEDQEYNTSISRAFVEKHQEVVDYLLKQMNGEKPITFIKDLMDNVMHPPLPEKDYALLETRYIPLLVECTKYSGFRYAFYSTNVVHKMTCKLEDCQKDIEASIQIANLILCTYFKFGYELDKYFVKQFLKCKGPELIKHMVHFYTNDWKLSEKDSIFVFLPMIGLVEIPEGRAWLSKNVLSVSEYFNLFEKDQLKMYISHSTYHHWCLESSVFKEINRVWIAFYNEIQKEQTFQRERHMAELLEQEERERDRKERKLEKIKQKQLDKEAEVANKEAEEAHKGTDAALIDLWTVSSNEDQTADDGSNLNANSSRNGLGEWDFMGSVDKPNGDVPADVLLSPTKCSTGLDEVAYTLGTVVDENWTTVCTKKQNQKQSKSKNKRKKKNDVKFPLDSFLTSTPTKVAGAARWADVAKGINKQPPTPIDESTPPLPVAPAHAYSDITTFGHTEFPSLDGTNDKGNRDEKPTKMTFHFHGDGEMANVTEADYYPDDGIDTDKIEQELDFDATISYEADCSNPCNDDQSAECVQEISKIEPDSREPSVTDSPIAEFDPISNVTDGSSTTPNDQLTRTFDSTNEVVVDSHQQIDYEVNALKGLEISNVVRHTPILGRQVDIGHNNCQEQAQTNVWMPVVQQVPGQCFQLGTPDSELKTPLAASFNDTDISFLQESIEDRIHDLISSGILTKKEVIVYKNQMETYHVFESMLNEYVSDPFMDLSEALAFLAAAEEEEVTEEQDEIDDMFGSPSHIPENMDDDNEDVNMYREVDQPYINDMTKDNALTCSKVIQRPSSSQPPLQYVPNLEPLKLNQSPSRVLVASDPAIIHCANTQPQAQQRPNRTEVRSTSSQQLNYPTTQACASQTISSPIKEFATLQDRPAAHEKSLSVPDDDFDLESIRKQTAVITPLKNADGSPLPSVNCPLGDGILKTACSLAHGHDDDNHAQPKELNGEPVESDSGNARPDDDRYVFPNFHTDTKLSGHYNSSDISVAHRMQQIQHQQLHNYYKENKERVCDDNSWENAKFVYYAQAAGMDKDTIDSYLEGRRETNRIPPTINSQRSVPQEQNAFGQHPEGTNAATASMNDQIRRCFPDVGQQQQPGLGYQTHQPVPGYQHWRMPLANGQQLSTMPPPNRPIGMVQAAPVALFPVMPYRLAGPVYQPPPTHPANIRNIQSQQAAMSKTVKNKIDDILSSMFKAKIKSVRWRQSLDHMRSLPSQQLQVIGKIIIPRNECDRQYIAYHNTGHTILGYLSDGSEVAVKITNNLHRPYKADDINRLMSMETACHQFVNKYRAIEMQDNLFYIATDLFEYTLPEFLSKTKTAEHGYNLMHVKLVFQLLRGLSTLHQQYLIVHAELRPDNILIDLEGNVKIGGYGFGRNVGRDKKFWEYTDDDKCWLAPEVLIHKQRISFKSDIWTAGMLIYFIFKNGQNPFGSEPHEIIHNICDQSYKLERIGEEPNHLIKTMMSLNRTERPAVSETLKHPLFWADEKRMRFINIVGSDIVREYRGSNAPVDKSSESMHSILSRMPSSLKIVGKWMDEIDPLVLREMKSFKFYKNTFTELVVFIFNCCNHFDKLSSAARDIIDEPCHYFLAKFPALLMMVHRAIKASDKKDKPCYKPFF